MKKILAALLTTALIFSPVGNIVFKDHATTVEAKGYKSGKKSFNINNNKSTNNSNFQNKKTEPSAAKKPANTTNPKGGFMSGGLMKGLMLGGLAGLLFGSLFANMGALGSILGLIINVLAIVVLISIIRKIFAFFKNNKKDQDPNPWRG
ncbi:hypothetical protein F7731_25065 [Cytobacillus depressus]|uniref:Preprotein translocase subunit Tim44 n=1 Tax=Cytobacillus depressus TaxID=1602942 RepID=A0A6L3UX02_9BACI|nr:hypothetical protein [Cytobacillus depressus]KAB2328591.1 hypothetical protein F7731_25065 [Cytobacillus depressus]